MTEELRSIFAGEIADDPETLARYSHDASLFEVLPKVVLFPKDNEDVAKAVRFVGERKGSDHSLSITARAAGSCMSGGPLNESLILDVTKHMSGILGFEGNRVTVLPGTFYRDFEKETLKRNLILPCYPASKNLAALGGMIGNNAAGEKTLRYGKMENFIKSLFVVFSDGNEYEVKPLSKEELNVKISQDNFEGNFYRNMWDLIEKNSDEISRSKPKVSKNSAGYYIWNVWDGETFDLTKLIVGSQGTLGIVTRATLRLVPVKKVSKLFVIFLKDFAPLGELVNAILPLHPESVESYDDATMKLAVRFFPEMLRSMKSGFFKLVWSFLPEAGMMLTGGIPKLIVLVEFTGDTEAEVNASLSELEKRVAHFNLKTHRTASTGEAEKYWTIRRESFNLLRKHIRGKRTAPFVDDVVVLPEHLPEFLPKMRRILDDHKLIYTIAGHAGNGNFHIIPLMDMRDSRNKDIILEVSDKIYDLVGEFHGSITAEHNDGIIRTPYLGKMYSPQMLEIFSEIKKIFDPQNIFNPGKKVPSTGSTSSPQAGSGQVGGSVEYLKNHLVNT